MSASTGSERRYAVIGQPIRHSLSPALFGWLFQRLGVAGRYEALEVPPEGLAELVAQVRSGQWAGVSVTLPHKETVRRHLDLEDPLARRIGAVNTLVPEGGRVRGHNTDAVGLIRALKRERASLRDASVVVLGAGGAARAAVFALLDEGARPVLIANRTPARAEALGRDARLAAPGARVEVLQWSRETLEAALATSQVLVQATRAGMGAAEETPLSGVALHPGLTVLDMVYRPLETALLKQARASGARAVDGLWMLVHQALEQLRLWTGRTVEDDEAVALHDHLSREAT